MKVTVYVIMEPGFDRPCVSITPPHSYQKKPDSRIYAATLDLPDWCEVDGRMAPATVDVTNELPASQQPPPLCETPDPTQPTCQTCGAPGDPAEHCHFRSPFGAYPCSLEAGHDGMHHGVTNRMLYSW